jgi:signal transduction histidine kinase/CheY-like chemotaxis protein
MLLLPWTTAASQDGSLPVAALSFPLIMVFVFAVTIGWLLQQWRKGIHLNREALHQVQLFEQTIDHAPWPILVIDQRLEIVAANPQAGQQYGRQQLVGSFFPDIVPEAARHPLLQALQEGRSNGKSTEEAQTLPESFAEAHCHLVSINARPYALWYGVEPEDQPEQEATAFLAQAEESANRMKSEFIANINHEVRTPMNAIIGYTEMLASSPLGAKEKRFVETIHKSSMALVSIFNDIMELSKIDSGRLQIMASSVRLELVIREVEGLYRDQAREKGIHLQCEVQAHLPKSYVLDGVRLKQVLHNLMSNAIKFTSEGTVRLLVQGAPSAQQSGCYDLEFIVEDTGIGITPKDQEKIFEVFRQREETIAKRYGGVGLGLTLCSRLVAMMGGRIDLFSTFGEGSRFTVFLKDIPLADPIPGDEPDVDAPGEQTGQQPLTMLVVDDVDLIKDVFVDFLQDSPHKIVTAATSEEALRLARSERPDIIFMDLNLSGSDGRIVTEQIRRDPQLAASYIVVMTGEILDEADYRPLFDDFLQKPFRLDVLKEILAKFARGSARQSSSPLGDSRAKETDNDYLVDSICNGWNEELEQMLLQATRSGSLADAAELGAALSSRGRSLGDTVLMALGDDLLQFAAEPDIIGVDRLLALFSRSLNRKGL